MKTIFSKGNLINVLLIGAFLVLMFVPSAKALMIRGLMEFGLFKPGIENTTEVMSLTQPDDLRGVMFKDAKGRVIDLASLKGKVIFINFWATWCPPCLAEMPAVNKLYEKFKAHKDVVFILADADSDLMKAQKFMDRKRYSLPVYQVASHIPKEMFKGALPTTIVIDKKGRMAYNEVGAANYASQKFIDFMNSLINI